jgi:hypothetical protein
MVREVIATRGWRGLYLGMVPTLWRDVPGYARIMLPCVHNDLPRAPLLTLRARFA